MGKADYGDVALQKFIRGKVLALKDKLDDPSLSGKNKGRIEKDYHRFLDELISIGGSLEGLMMNKGGLAKKKTTKTKMAKGGSVRKGHTDRRKGMFYK